MARTNYFLISDTHFGHSKMTEQEYESRPNNFSELIEYNWNNTVSDNDIVFHLGDFSLLNKSTTIQIIKRLNGQKVLVLGNHDRNTYQWYMRNGFIFACSRFSLYRNKKSILFSHHPIIEKSNLFDINIHGHIHRNQTELNKHNIPFILENEDYSPRNLDKFVNIRIKI